MNNVKKYFFENLKKIRKEKKFTIDDVVDGIKINKIYVESIENGDFNLLPKTYVRLFLKSYAKFIGIDQKKILEDYQNYISGTDVNRNKTPNFIKTKVDLEKVKIKDRHINKNKMIFLRNATYIFLGVFAIIFSFSITKEFFFNSSYKNQIENWNENKLNWNNDFENYEIFESETHNINLLNKNNTINYRTLKHPDKIIITDNEGKNISNKILNPFSIEKSIFNTDIKFALLNAMGEISINNNKISIKYPGMKIVGNIRNNILTISYIK